MEVERIYGGGRCRIGRGGKEVVLVVVVVERNFV